MQKKLKTNNSLEEVKQDNFIHLNDYFVKILYKQKNLEFNYSKINKYVNLQSALRNENKKPTFFKLHSL